MAVLAAGTFFATASAAAGFFVLAALTLVATFDAAGLADDFGASVRSGFLMAFFAAVFLTAFFTRVPFAPALALAAAVLRFVAVFFATTSFAFARAGAMRLTLVGALVVALVAAFFNAFFATFFFTALLAALFVAFFAAVFFTAARFIAIPRSANERAAIRTGAGKRITNPFLYPA